MVRPEYVQFAQDPNQYDYSLNGKILAEYALGSRVQYQIESATGQAITVEKLREERVTDPENKVVTLGFNADRTHVIEDA